MPTSNPHVHWLCEAARLLNYEGRTALENICEGAAREIEALSQHRDALLASHLRQQDETSGSDADEAAKWRAFRNCGRIRVLGSAGFTRADQYRFVTLEAWTQHDAHSSPEALEMLEEFVAVAQQCSSVEPTGNGGNNT